MKILLTTLGSRGDVQPYLALAVGLKNAGHHPTLAAPETFSEWIQPYGVEAAPIRFNPQEVMQRLGKGGGGIRTLISMLSLLKSGMAEAQDDVWRAAQDTDFILQSATGMGALEAASLLGIPAAFAYLFPFAPTRAFPMFWLPYRFSLGGGYNLLTHKMMARLLWKFGGPVNNQWRKRLGLKPFRSPDELFAHAQTLNTPFLYGYSPTLLPKPADWDALQHVTGYWYLNEPDDFQPPADLLHFLESGPPPVYIGFGSMNSENPERQTQIALKALEMTGQRGLLLTGWGGMSRVASSSPAPPSAPDGLPNPSEAGIWQSPLSERVFFIENIPHSWLFPRVAAVVHHGGAGTTGAGLRAGIPSILTPFGGDQSAWADLVVKASVGPKTPGIQKLTAEKLADSIQTALHDHDLRTRAAALGEKIRAENGIAHAVEIIERHAATYHPPQ
ncbi:MAG: glycosyltransferase [Anaerolineales bacterium]